MLVRPLLGWMGSQETVGKSDSSTTKCDVNNVRLTNSNSTTMPEEPDPFAELKRIKASYVDETLKWYSSHSTWPRVVFRLSGLTTIVSSLALPFMAASKGFLLEFGVPIASVLIAVLTGLNSFFGWQRTWEKRKTAQLALEGMTALWETQMDAARNLPDAGKGYEAALAATQEILKLTQALTVNETVQWFTQVKFPEATPNTQK